MRYRMTRKRGEERDTRPRLTRFRCWWCARVLGVKKLHHTISEVEPKRRCCHECYLREGSNYLAVYAGEEQERAEVARQLGEEGP